MPDITSLFVTRLYRAKLNELAKKKVDYDELRVTCETVAEDDEAGDVSGGQVVHGGLSPGRGRRSDQRR